MIFRSPRPRVWRYWNVPRVLVLMGAQATAVSSVVACLAMAIHIMTEVVRFAKAVGVLCGLTHMCQVQIFLTERHLVSHAIPEVVSMATAQALVPLETISVATSALETLITMALVTSACHANRMLMEVMLVLMTAPR